MQTPTLSAHHLPLDMTEGQDAVMEGGGGGLGSRIFYFFNI